MGVKKKSGLEKYIPRKNFFDFFSPLFKPFLVLVVLISVMLATAFATNYIVGEGAISGAVSFVQEKLGLNEGAIVVNQVVVPDPAPTATPAPSNKVTNIVDGSVVTNNNDPSPPSTPSQITQTVQPRVTDYSTIISDITSSEFFDSLPDNAKINLKFYNFDTGERAWEKSFVLSGTSMTEGEISDADLTMAMHYKYVALMKTQNLCDVMNQAQAKGDYYIDTEKSTTSLMWKYKGMLKYRDCLGI